ncbi:MAG: DMT family transporter [Deltaproteobacteria bacterium]|nr:DMT family transporter [Deltaproteobacteria bacterium]
MPQPLPHTVGAPTTQEAFRSASLRLVLASVFFGIMAVGTKWLSMRLPGPQIAAMRMAFGTLVFALLAARTRALLRTSRPQWLAARGLFGGLAVLIYFVSIAKVGVGLATVIHYSAPVWAALLGRIVLKERMSLATAFALTLALAGVGLVMGPTLGEAWRVGAAGRVQPVWYLLSLASAFVSAAALVSVRAARRASALGPPDHEWTLFGSFSLFGLLAALPFAVAPLGTWVWPSGLAWLVAVGVAAVSVLAQVIMTRALAHVPASAPGVANQLSVVIATTGGVLWFNEHITALTLVGATMIVAGVLASLRGRPPVPVAAKAG